VTHLAVPSHEPDRDFDPDYAYDWPKARGTLLQHIGLRLNQPPVLLARVKDWPYGPLHYGINMLFEAHSYPTEVFGPPIWADGHDTFCVLYLGYLWAADAQAHLVGPHAVNARAHYLHALHAKLLAARETAPGSPWHASLVTEYELVLGHEREWVRKTIAPRLDGLPGPDECWLWKGGARDGRPAIDFRYAQSVPVHRLLWPVMRPDAPLSPRDKPRRNNLCTNTLCVNPRHFNVPGYTFKVRPTADPRGRRGLPTQYGQFRYTWDAALHVQEMGDGRRVVCCPKGHPLSPRVQRQYEEQGGGRGRAHCGQCYQEYMGHVPLIRVRQPTAWEQVSAPSYRELEDVARMELWRGPTNPTLKPQLPEPEPEEDPADLII
jgi:hypothetical protein